MLGKLSLARMASLLMFLALVAVVAVMAAKYTPGAWYGGLAKPWWTPPNWLFGPVWSVLYVMIAVAGWLTWHAQEATLARLIWTLQLVLNGIWSPIMFGRHDIGLALVVIVAMLISIMSFVAVTWRRQRSAALLFVPYLAWVGFATALNFAVWRLNP